MLVWRHNMRHGCILHQRPAGLTRDHCWQQHLTALAEAAAGGGDGSRRSLRPRPAPFGRTRASIGRAMPCLLRPRPSPALYLRPVSTSYIGG